MNNPEREDYFASVLLGTAVGDALGLATEGMGPEAIKKRFGRVTRYHFLGTTGFVSDDTEQSALIAQALVRHPTNVEACVKSFRWSLLGWFARLPWGIGFATLRACLKIALGFSRTGIASAGNGAAMRAAIVGAFFQKDPERRKLFGKALAEVTHTDPRATEGALFVAEVCANEGLPHERCSTALSVVQDPSLRTAIEKAMALASTDAPQEQTLQHSKDLGNTGFVLHTVPLATYAFVRWGKEAKEALPELIALGGDTDSIGAILGAWLGALHGWQAFPKEWIERLHDGPFGPSHLRSLAGALARVSVSQEGEQQRFYSAWIALVRNLALYPIVLAHGFRRMIPW